MQIFNLTNLNMTQEVPRAIYKPINISEDYIYFEKILITLEDTWSDGIWAYNLAFNKMHRIDHGHHVEYGDLYDIDTPSMSWNGTSKIAPGVMYFATITELNDDDYLEFYEIDLVSGVQRVILGFKFNKESLMYKNMEILAPGYLLFRLSYDMELSDTDFFDVVYLIDVAEKKYYEVRDESFKINYGQKIIIGEGEETKMVFDEYFLSEEEQYEMLTSDDLELAFDLPGDMKEEDLHKNGVSYIYLADFIRETKEGKTRYSFRTIDELYGEGSIRIIGETKDNIYYRKSYYDYVLRERGDFLSLRQIGSYGVYKINKETMETNFIRNVHGDVEVKTNANRAYTIIPQNKVIKIQDFDTEEIIYNYKKRYIGKAKEQIIEFANDEYLMIGLESVETLSVMRYMIVDAINDEILIIGNDVLMLQEYLFVI